MVRMTVAGGSSPFTIGLIDSLLPHLDELPTCELVLHGRNIAALGLLADYARFVLEPSGWSVSHTTDLTLASREANIIIHQIRYGGLELRRLGETICNNHHVLADETLGPAALITAVLSLPHLKKTCETIEKSAPTAVVLNLTNPLSLSTSVMSSCMPNTVIGICELPTVTASMVSEELGIQSEKLSWKYSGFNHRGFLHDLFIDGVDARARLTRALKGRRLNGVDVATITELEVVPTKYFPLFQNSSPSNVEKASRAQVLKNLRGEVLSELKQNPCRSPKSLRKRYLEWYPKAVVPILLAICDCQPAFCLVNSTTSDQINGLPLTREGLAKVSSDCFEMSLTEPKNAAAKKWLGRYEQHEKAMLEGLSSTPKLDWIHNALSADPTIQTKFDELSRVVFKTCQEYQIE